MVPFEGLGTDSYSHSIVTGDLFCIISEIKRDISRKSRFFLTPPARDAPLGWSHKVWYRYGKTRMCGYPTAKKVREHIYWLQHNIRAFLTPSQPPRRTDTARRQAALVHSIARQNVCCNCNRTNRYLPILSDAVPSRRIWKVQNATSSSQSLMWSPNNRSLSQSILIRSTCTGCEHLKAADWCRRRHRWYKARSLDVALVHAPWLCVLVVGLPVTCTRDHVIGLSCLSSDYLLQDLNYYDLWILYLEPELN